MSDEMKPCPLCKSPYGYLIGTELYACPECAHEWNLQDLIEKEEVLVVKDSNGNVLQNGDTVVVIPLLEKYS